MASIKTRLAGRAARRTARHGVLGTTSKLRRRPMRSGTLLGAGAVVGFLAGRLSGRRPEHAN